MEDAHHHHAVDAWNDDWCTEPYKRPPIVNHTCFECGETRD
jgi:P2-related tail formation protein